MLPFLRLGPFTLQTPGLALLVGVWVGSALAEKEAARLRLIANDIYNLIFYGLVAGIIGARLAYAIQYASAYFANPLSLFALTPSTLSPNAGLVIGIAVAVLFGRRKKLPLRPTLDALAPGLAAFMIAFAVAHFLGGDAFGAPAQLPWAIYLWDDYRHPSQLYQAVAAAIILVVVWRHLLGHPGGGINFLLVVGLSAAARVFLEAFRGDSVIWSGGFRAAQIIGVLVLAASMWLIRVWTRPALATEVIS
ncbi:MAG: prolipoprotein diacylglyceryl transferase family protein [Chloroflexota bacterium]